MEAAGLAYPRAVTVSRNDVRAGKPAPECYLRAGWLLGRDPADCIVVEDSVTGASAGLAAGMTTLFWPQVETPTPEGAERISDIRDLAARIRERTGA